MSAAEGTVIWRDFREDDWAELERIVNRILPDRPQEDQKWFENVRTSTHVYV